MSPSHDSYISTERYSSKTCVGQHSQYRQELDTCVNSRPRSIWLTLHINLSRGNWNKLTMSNFRKHQTSCMTQPLGGWPADVLLHWSNSRRDLSCSGRQEYRSIRRPSSFPDIDNEDNSNPLTVSNYVHDIIACNRRAEPLFVTDPDFLDYQPELSKNMRAILVDWLIDVHLKFKLMPETIYLAISYIDRFLHDTQITSDDLQLVGITAMLIASKYQEIWAPEIRDFIYISDNAYTNADIAIMEKNILNSLGYQLTVPTPYVFLQRLLKAIRAEKKVAMLSQYLLELALVNYNMLIFTCSEIAAAAVYTANKCIYSAECWNYLLERHAVYNLDELRECALALTCLQKQARVDGLGSVFTKFVMTKNASVALISHHEDLLQLTPEH